MKNPAGSPPTLLGKGVDKRYGGGPNKSRNLEITREVLRGSLLREAGRGLTVERTRQIVRKVCRLAWMLHFKTHGGYPGTNLYEHMDQIRAKKDRWLELIDELEKYWEQTGENNAFHA